MGRTMYAWSAEDTGECCSAWERTKHELFDKVETEHSKLDGE
jgi:hypothetical protein